MTARGFLGFHKGRQLIYGGLLIFVVAIGLPIVGVPALRNRLSERAITLRAAAAGDVKPAILQVGENREPLPAEYEEYTPPLPAAAPPPPIVQTFSKDSVAPVAPQPIVRTRVVPSVEKLRTLPSAPIEIVETKDQDQSQADAQPAADTEPKYQQGQIEREAYDLLLKTNSTIAGMIQGSDPSLRFKSWGVATRSNDIYWVRVKFQSDGVPDVEYIWQVKLETKQVTPLSYNARAIS